VVPDAYVKSRRARIASGASGAEWRIRGGVRVALADSEAIFFRA
jgi:hypothetical protein